MAPKPKRPCNKPGCPQLTTDRFCPTHTKAEQQRYDQERGTAAQRGYDSNWRKVRNQILNIEPLCRPCKRQGKITPASLVHHIDRNPHNNYRDNLVAMCATCHAEEHKHENFGR